MTKFNEKSLHNFPLAFFYSAMQAFDSRIGAVNSSLARLGTMREEQHQLFGQFDEAYKRSLKSQTTKVIGDLDKVRDHTAYVIMNVSKLWATKLDDDALNIHGRRVWQAFKDFDFRTDEALVAENAKIRNIEQVFASADLTADLAAMGLTQLNQLMAETTTQIEQLMAQRNEEQSTIIVGELKSAREALDAHYRSFITYLNAVQEIQPEEGISQAAQYYNEDLHKVELQIAQSRKGGSVSQKPSSDSNSGNSDNGGGDNNGGGENTNPTNPTNPDNGGGSGTGTITPGGGSGGGDNGGGSGGSGDNGDTD